MIGAAVAFRFCHIQRIYVAGSSGGDCSAKAELDDCRGLGGPAPHGSPLLCGSSWASYLCREPAVPDWLPDKQMCFAHLFSFILPLSLSCILFLNSPSRGWSGNPSSISASAFPHPPRSALWVTCCPNVTFHPWLPHSCLSQRGAYIPDLKEAAPNYLPTFLVVNKFSRFRVKQGGKSSCVSRLFLVHKIFLPNFFTIHSCRLFFFLLSYFLLYKVFPEM